MKMKRKVCDWAAHKHTKYASDEPDEPPSTRFDSMRIKLEIKIKIVVVANEQTNSAIHNKAIKWNYKSFMPFYRHIFFHISTAPRCVNWLFTKQWKSSLFFILCQSFFLLVYFCLPNTHSDSHTHEARDKIPFANIS